MSVRLKGGNGPNLRAARRSDTLATVLHLDETVQTSGGTTDAEVISDANFNSYTGATYHSGGLVVVEGMGDFEIVNLNPNVGAVSIDSLITRISPGVLNLLIRNKFITLPLTLDLTDKSEAAQPRDFVSTVTGSLAEHCQQQVDSRIDNTKTMNANGKVFTSQNHTSPAYVRNTNLWCADVDLTCISPWNSNGGATKAGTLITPRHIINTAHYEYPVGTTVRFVAGDNTVHDRTLLSKVRHPNYLPYSPDLTIYTLSSDLPAAISPCELMPLDWNDYLVQNVFNRPPALGLDQEEKALIIDFNTAGSFRTPVDADRLLFHENKISGDSGNPAFLIVNGALVLVTVWTYGGSGGGTPVAHYISDLNAMIVTADAQAGVSTGYTVTEADFSAFPNYA